MAERSGEGDEFAAAVCRLHAIHQSRINGELASFLNSFSTRPQFIALQEKLNHQISLNKKQEETLKELRTTVER